MPRAEVMPVEEGDKRKNMHYDSCDEAMRPTERNAGAAHDPEVERALPRAPESMGRVVVRHATHHVLRAGPARHKAPTHEKNRHGKSNFSRGVATNPGQKF